MSNPIPPLLSLLIAASLPAQVSGFRTGDLYLYTPSTVFAGTNGYMVLRIDPAAMITTPLIHMQQVASAVGGATYDPFRDRILVSASLGGAGTELWAVDAAGSAQSLGHRGTALHMMTPRGDGIVYCQVANNSSEVRYLDASGNLRMLMDAAGTTPFAAPPIHRMVYHPGENALFVTSPGGGVTCAGSTLGMTVVHKVPLSNDGTRAAGQILCGSFDVSTSAEEPVALGLAPGGQVLVVVDTNSNAREPRMLMVDPVTLAITPHASNGYYIGAAATNSGIWSQVAGKTLVVDTFNDRLRAFDPGEVGSGTILPPRGVSQAGGHSELLTMFEIGPIAIPGTFRGFPAEISLSSGGSQTLQFNAGAAFGRQTYWMLGSVSGWTPGTLFRGTRLWIVPDFYTDYTVASANAGFLSNTLGTLDASGSATGAVTLPPSMPPALAGLLVHHVTGVFDPSLNPLFASEPVSLLLVP